MVLVDRNRGNFRAAAVLHHNFSIDRGHLEGHHSGNVRRALRRQVSNGTVVLYRTGEGIPTHVQSDVLFDHQGAVVGDGQSTVGCCICRQGDAGEGLVGPVSVLAFENTEDIVGQPVRQIQHILRASIFFTNVGNGVVCTARDYRANGTSVGELSLICICCGFLTL